MSVKVPLPPPPPPIRPAGPPGKEKKAPAGAEAAIEDLLRKGLMIVGLLFVAIVGWGFTTDISGAVIAPGVIALDSNVKKVQHPAGGIVSEIRVRDGDVVKAGDVLVRLDETTVKADLSIVTRNLNELLARKARLEAERDEATEVHYPAELVAAADADPDAAHILKSESKVFELRTAQRSGQKSVLTEREDQLRDEITGQSEQAASKAKELEITETELARAKELWVKNLVPITRLSALERDQARLTGEKGQLAANIAQAKGKLGEIELQILQIDRDATSEVGDQLREIEAKIGELTERKVAAEAEMKRIIIRAPQDGTVHQSTVHTVGGVIAAGEVLMLVVPGADKLIAEAKIAPQDIDQLWVGQPALLRFAAFNQRTTPEIGGTVDRISADISTDERTGLSYYTVRVALSAGEVAKLGDVKIVPGMPVETMIKTADRRVISYLVKPLEDQIMRAFREN